MKRREFIGIAAAGAGGVMVSAYGDESEVAAATFAYPRLLEILHDEHTVRDLGRRYRELVPAEDNPDALAHAIVAGPFGSSPPWPSSMGTRMDEQVQREFASGTTVTLNGWILSVTEARQCALYSFHTQ